MRNSLRRYRNIAECHFQAKNFGTRPFSPKPHSHVRCCSWSFVLAHLEWWPPPAYIWPSICMMHDSVPVIFTPSYSHGNVTMACVCVCVDNYGDTAGSAVTEGHWGPTQWHHETRVQHSWAARDVYGHGSARWEPGTHFTFTNFVALSISAVQESSIVP